MPEVFRSVRPFLIAAVIILSIGIVTTLTIDTFDINIWLAGLHNPLYHTLFGIATQFGEPLFYGIAFVILLFVRFRYAVVLPLILIANSVFVGLLKSVFKHPRPYSWMEENGRIDHFPFVEGVYIQDGFNSFPSGHTWGAFAIFTFLACLTRSRVLQFVFLFLALMAAFSRMYFMHHFLKDVVFGAAMGVVFGLVGFYMQDYYLTGRKGWERSLIG